MIGQVLNGNYRLTDLVGSGGYADVYLARDLRTNTIVAVKVLHAHVATDPDIAARFEREVNLARRLQTPHIARVLDSGQDPTSPPYLVMEFVQGLTLAELIKRNGPFPIKEAVEIGDQLLSALGAAHAIGIIHRDVKPQNLMIDTERRLRVLDFGVARVAGAGTMTSAGELLGTPEYMSSEQIAGQQVDRRTDIYAAGAVLYHLLTGQPPYLRYADTDIWELIGRVRSESPTPLRQLRVDLPPGITAVVERAMARDPGQRYQTAFDMQMALASAARAELALDLPGATPRRGAHGTEILPAPGQSPTPPFDDGETPQWSPGETAPGESPPGLAGPGLQQPGPRPPVGTPPNAPQPGRYPPGPYPPGVHRPGGPRQGPYQPGPYQPAPGPPGPYQPGGRPPGPFQPDPRQPGPQPGGPYQPGPQQPGGYVPGPYQPGPYEPGTPRPGPQQPGGYSPGPYAPGPGPHDGYQPIGAPYEYPPGNAFAPGRHAPHPGPQYGPSPSPDERHTGGSGGSGGLWIVLILAVLAAVGGGLMLAEVVPVPEFLARPTATPTRVAATTPAPAVAPAPAPVVASPAGVPANSPGPAPPPATDARSGVPSPRPSPAPGASPMAGASPAARSSPAAGASPAAAPPSPQAVPGQTTRSPGILLADDFENPNAAQLPRASSHPTDFVVAYDRGEYVMNKVNAAMAAAPIVFLPASFDNSVIGIDVRIVGDANARYAFLVCRDSSADGIAKQYRASLVPAGQRLVLSRWENGTQSVLADLRDDGIQAGNGTNRLELSCANSTISAAVNGKVLASVDDKAFTRGDHGLGAGTFAGVEGTVEARFDNLVVRAP